MFLRFSYIPTIFFLVSEARIQKQSHVRGFIFGFAQAIPNFAYGLIMWFGGYLVEIDDLEYKDAFKWATHEVHVHIYCVY